MNSWSVYLLYILAVSGALPWTSRAQEATTGTEGASCAFSCPEADMLSQPLVKYPNTVGYDSFYSVFECIYHNPRTASASHKCTYDKISGVQRLGSTGDGCLPVAVPCPQGEAGTPPMFSNNEKDEVPPWVVSGRYLLYLKEHKP